MILKERNISDRCKKFINRRFNDIIERWKILDNIFVIENIKRSFFNNKKLCKMK